METVRKVFTQTTWQLVGKAVTSLSTIIILGFVTREYGAFGTGVFTLALTYLSFFFFASDFGLNAHILPELGTGKAGHVWQKLLGFRLMLALLLVLVALVVISFWPGQSGLFKQAASIGVLAIFGSAVFVTTNAIFQAKLRYDLSIICSSISAVVGLVLTVYLALNSAPLPYLVLVSVFSWAICATLALVLVHRFVGNIAPDFDLGFSRKLVSEAWPISAALILNTVYFRADAFILSLTHSFTEVGVYNLAYQVFQNALVLPTFIMNGFYPVMLRQFSEDQAKFKQSLFKGMGFMVAIAVAGIAATFLLSPFIVNLISGGRGFSGSITSLNILSLGFPAYFASSLMMWTLIVLKKYKSLVLIYLAGLIFNVAANIIYIPAYSYIAASWVTGISEYLILILQTTILFRIYASHR